MKISKAEMLWGSVAIRAAAIEKCFADLLSESSYVFEAGSIRKAVLDTGCLDDLDGTAPVLMGNIADFISFEVTPGDNYISSGSLIDYAVSQFYYRHRHGSSCCFVLRLKIGEREVPLLSGNLTRMPGRDMPEFSSIL